MENNAYNQEYVSQYKEILPDFLNMQLNQKQTQLQQKVVDLTASANASDLWNNPDNAKKVTQELSSNEKSLAQISTVISLQADLDTALQEEALASEFNSTFIVFKKHFNEVKVSNYLSGRFDRNGAIFSIFAGQGGTEANDWAEMLLRMYMRYFASKGWQVEIIEDSKGTETGISSVSLKVMGDYAYGYCKVEHGTHRLVRISPFNAASLRQTSFAGVEVLPVLEETQKIEIKSEELEFAAVRSSGAGGQNVNKVATSVRIRHIPSGIVVTSSSQRSQQQNRELALEMLQGKLELASELATANIVSAEKGDSFKASWGNQIRNYVLHPYKLVKDLRTGIETNQTEAVLDGDLQEFLDAGVIFLAARTSPTK